MATLSGDSLAAAPVALLSEHIAALQVKGRGPSDQYIVFPGHYCSCHSFFWDVVSRKHAVYVSTPAAVASSRNQLQHCHAVLAGPELLKSVLTCSASTSWLHTQQWPLIAAPPAGSRTTSWRAC